MILNTTMLNHVNEVPPTFVFSIFLLLCSPVHATRSELSLLIFVCRILKSWKQYLTHSFSFTPWLLDWFFSYFNFSERFQVLFFAFLNKNQPQMREKIFNFQNISYFKIYAWSTVLYSGSSIDGCYMKIKILKIWIGFISDCSLFSLNTPLAKIVGISLFFQLFS